MASKKQTAKTTNRVRDRATGQVLSFHHSHRSAMVETGRQWAFACKTATMDNLTHDGKWWNPGEGFVE